MIVVDASVVLNWLMPQERVSEQAVAIRQAHVDGRQPCAGPELLFYEVANALITKSHVAAAEALAAVISVLGLELATYPFDEGDYPFALRVARDHGLSLYDACYVALAKTLNCEFVTADRRLHGKVSHLKWARLLE
jgi:predicted nucleic acid-binding protein